MWDVCRQPYCRSPHVAVPISMLRRTPNFESIVSESLISTDARTGQPPAIAEAPGLRDKMVLATKGGIILGVPYDSSPAYLTSAIDISLKRLRTDHVELWQIHRPDLLTHPQEIARTLEDAHRAGKIGDWRKAVAYGVVFFVVLFVVQFSFAYFLMSPWSMNPIFATDNFDYATPDTWYKVRREFYPWDATAGAMRVRLILAVVLAIVSARIGLAWGSWMRRVRR